MKHIIEEIIDGEFTSGMRHVWITTPTGRIRKPINFAHRNKVMKDEHTQEDWERRFGEYFYDAYHSLTPRQIEHIKISLVAPLLAAREKQVREETRAHYY